MWPPYLECNQNIQNQGSQRGSRSTETGSLANQTGDDYPQSVWSRPAGPAVECFELVHCDGVGI